MTVLVVEGPDRGRHARVEVPNFVIGSGPQTDFRLTDKTVSREHLRLAVSEAGVVLRDSDSRNGTWLGPTRICDALVTSDVTLRIGETSLALRLDAGASELPISDKEEFGDAVARSGSMRYVFAILERAAASSVSVLLEGESGVGKEVLARAIHLTSPRAEQPFITVDCGAIPANLVESELFGHDKGAFTGAFDHRVGLMEQAHHGTLFLDEIGELSVDLQPKLLRFLEMREVRPVGGRDVRKVDVRVIAATNRRLAEGVEAGTFRKDLYYRLSVARVIVPPLRDRPEDIALLARRFLRTVTGRPDTEVPDDLAALLEGYRWPGNVRELRNVIERYATLGVRDARGLFDETSNARIDAGQGPFDLSLGFHEARKRTLDQFERAYLAQALELAGGVVTRAAEIAGIARPSFYRMLDRHRAGERDSGDP